MLPNFFLFSKSYREENATTVYMDHTVLLHLATETLENLAC